MSPETPVRLTKVQPNSWSRRILVTAGVGLLALPAIAYGLLSRETEPEASAPDAPATVSAVTTFRQAEQEQRFTQAVTRGKEDTIATLREALDRAKAEESADPAYVGELERQLAAREEELAATRRQGVP